MMRSCSRSRDLRSKLGTGRRRRNGIPIVVRHADFFRGPAHDAGRGAERQLGLDRIGQRLLELAEYHRQSGRYPSAMNECAAAAPGWSASIACIKSPRAAGPPHLGLAPPGSSRSVWRPWRRRRCADSRRHRTGVRHLFRVHAERHGQVAGGSRHPPRRADPQVAGHIRQFGGRPQFASAARCSSSASVSRSRPNIANGLVWPEVDELPKSGAEHVRPGILGQRLPHVGDDRFHVSGRLNSSGIEVTQNQPEFSCFDADRSLCIDGSWSRGFDRLSSR